MIQLACTHCGHRFELERQEGSVCPSCGWSSSVVPAAQLAETASSPRKAKSASSSISWLPGFLLFAFKILGIALTIIFLIWGAIKFWSSRSFRSRQDPEKAVQMPSPGVAMSASSASSILNPEELAALGFRLEVKAAVQLTDEEQNLLQRSIDLTAGNVEKLPSGNWTADQFKEYLETQEKNFHMPLPRSYKKKLEELFETHYAPAYDLFLKGQIQAARDAYISSLAFPVYDNDLRKHRAVILTMLRSFVNDTIAKIGAVNFTLARQGVNNAEEQIGAAYAALQQQIRSSQWSESLSGLQKLQTLLPDPAAVAPVLQAPPYGADFQKIDQDIQPVLLNLLQVPAWAFDLNALKGDLDVKKALLLKLTDPDRKTSVENYGKAFEKIQAKDWSEAMALLREVKSPEELKRDAEQKLSLIEKLTSEAAKTASGA